MHATATDAHASSFDARLALVGFTGFAPPLLAIALGGNPIVALVAWTVVAAAVWVPLVLRRAPARPVFATTVIGLVAGVCAGIVDAAYDMMFVTGSLATGAQLFAFALVLGLVWGALFGAVARLVAQRRGGADAAAPK
jgi:hypothetical protein